MADSRHAFVTDFGHRRRACGACTECDVRDLAVCAALDEDELSALESIMTTVTIEANTVLVTEGDALKRVYTLTAGMLRLSTMLPDGRRQIVGFLMPGDYLGLADEDTYSQTAEAVVPSRLCSFQASRMGELVERYPRLKDRLHGMTRQALRQARDSQIILGRLAPVEKLASFLLAIARRAEAREKTADVVALPMTRIDIADYLGLTIETVSRSFTKLKAQGVIRLPAPHLVEIVDRRALEAVAGIAFS